MSSPEREPTAQMSLGEVQVKLETARRQQARFEEGKRQSLDGALNDLQAYQRWSSRWGPWFARVALIPALALLAGGCYVVVVALLQGQILSFGKYSTTVHVKSVEPFLYWFSLGAYVALTVFFAWLAVVTLRVAISPGK